MCGRGQLIDIREVTWMEVQNNQNRLEPEVLEGFWPVPVEEGIGRRRSPQIQTSAGKAPSPESSACW